MLNEKLNNYDFKGKNKKKNAAKYGEAITYLPLDASGANCTDLILVAIETT